MPHSVRHLARRESDWRIDLLAEPALADDAAALVFDYLLGRGSSRRVLDGSRSVVLPSPGTGIHGGIKIKGAGLEGSRRPYVLLPVEQLLQVALTEQVPRQEQMGTNLPSPGRGGRVRQRPFYV